MNRKYFIALLFSIAIGIVVALGSPLAQAQQNNSKDSIRVIILKNFPPQFVTTPDGPSGLAVEMMREVAQRASLEIEFVTLNSWKEVYEPLKNGTVDAISNMGISEARKKILEFTDPYEVFNIKIFVRAETNDIKNIADLKGRLLGVQTTNVLTKGLVNSGDYHIKQYSSFKLALLGLLSGEVDAVPAPTEPFLLIAREARLDDRIKFVGPSLLEVKRAIALPKGRTELRDRLNTSLREFKQMDDYQKLLTKWYGQATLYWTTTRLVMFMGVVFAASMLIMGIWRYYSIIGLNRRIHDSENQKKLIIQTVPDLIWSKNTEGIYLACNARFERLYGAAEAEIIGKTDYDFFDCATADAIFKQDKLVIEGKSLTYEEEVTFADDDHKEVMLMTKNPMKSVDGTVLGFLGVGRDITERKLAEEELIESENRFRELISQMSAGFALHEIIVNDAGIPIDYRFLEVNDSFEKLTGLKRGEVIGWTVLTILPQTEAYWIEIYSKVALTGKSVVYENFSKELGKHFEVIVYRPQENQFATIILDISERKQVEEELEKQMRALQQAQDIAHLGYFEINWRTGSEHWSDGLLNLLGYAQSEESFSYEQFVQHIHEKDREYVADILKQSLAEETPMNIEFRLVDNNDKVLTIHGVAKHSFDENGSPLNTQGVFQDISASKVAEKELRKYREGLEGLVEERTSELRKMVNIMAGREVRIAELKKEVECLQDQLEEAGLQPPSTQALP